MNVGTAKAIIDDLISDISDVLATEPRKELCIWWRGRLSGVTDTVTAVADEVDLQRANLALEALYEAEEMADSGKG